MGKAIDWIKGKRHRLVMVGQALEGIVIVLLQWLGAGAVGYFIAQAQVRNFVIEERADHLAEIQRLQETYTNTLGYMSAQAKRAADSSQEAADQSAQAAVQSKDTARAAKKAVGQNSGNGTSPITEAQRSEVNRKIEAVNRKVKEKP